MHSSFEAATQREFSDTPLSWQEAMTSDPSDGWWSSISSGVTEAHITVWCREEDGKLEKASLTTPVDGKAAMILRVAVTQTGRG